MIEFLLEIPFRKELNKLNDFFIINPVIELYFDKPDYEFIAWGDPIYDSDFKDGLRQNPEPGFILSNLCGHYYYILLNKTAAEIIIGNSLFSILPLYFSYSQEKIVFSDNALTLGEYLKRDEISRRFILETMLFNYPLFNQSIIEDVKLLPSNSYMNISEKGPQIIKHTCIEEYFSANPLKWKKSVNNISSLFLEKVKKYLPEEEYVHSLTGGFDGRTLVSAGLYYKKNFSCYCFGSPGSKDIDIAANLSHTAGIPFESIILDDLYIKKDSLINGREFIENSSGTATFARAHYLYAAKKLSEKFRCVVTGNFGSEVFRAVHIPGVVISKNLYEIFNSGSPEEGVKAIEKSIEFKYLNKVSFKMTWEELKEDLHKLPCYNKEYSEFTKNQKFYVFVFEELFRKYFGAEMVNQFKYLKNRTPFLDIDFLKALFKTELAGIHSEFFEHNPLKRYKGQILYAHIIHKGYPLFGQMITDKGYRPDDLLNFSGKLNIVLGYFKKNIWNSSIDSDPYAVSNAWNTNKDFWLKVPVSEELFNIDKKRSDVNKEVLFKILSLSYIKNVFTAMTRRRERRE